MGGWIHVQQQGDTLNMFNGWVGVPKVKYFNIVTVWVGGHMYSDRVTLWICLMGGWVFLK